MKADIAGMNCQFFDVGPKSGQIENNRHPSRFTQVMGENDILRGHEMTITDAGASDGIIGIWGVFCDQLRVLAPNQKKIYVSGNRFIVQTSIETGL